MKKKKKQSPYRFLPFVIAFWAVGFAFYYQLDVWNAEFIANTEAIERGEATEVSLTVVKKWVQPGSGSGSDQDPDSHYARFDHSNVLGEEISRHLSYDEWVAIRVGQEFGAHLIENGDVRIESLDSPPGNAKWFMLGFAFVLGLCPMGMTAFEIYSRDSDPSFDPREDA